MGKSSHKQKNQSEPNLKGSFTSVLILGGLIIVSWVSALAIFMSR